MQIIKELREEKGESQTALGEAVGSSLRSVQNWESGKTRPSKSKLESIAQHFNVSVAYLYSEKHYDLKPSNVLVQEPTEFFTTKAGSVIEELPGGKYLLTVPMVPFKAQATYVSEYMDAEYISDLSRVSFIVDRIPLGNYRAFEIQNDSMNDATPEKEPSRSAILHGDVVLGREVGKQHWKNKLNTNSYPYWIIVHKNTIICKEIIKHDVENGIITCHSLNQSPEFQDFDLKLDDCNQIFNIIKKQV